MSNLQNDENLPLPQAGEGWGEGNTIVACTTAPGRAGVAVVRVSGSLVKEVCLALTGKITQPRHAEYLPLNDSQGQLIDRGIVLFFPAPHSFTGEDVLELQIHGSPVVIDNLLQQIICLNVRMANPGEFSERAFLHGKIDLAQAEAIADLIDSSTQQAARAALNSLEGEFSARIDGIINALIELRMYVEAAIDFPEEEIDFLSDGKVLTALEKIIAAIAEVFRTSKQGRLLRDGMNVVIIGKPNAGKSSLLNRLAGYDSAIVTDIPGTTRDVLREQIQIDGMPIHVIDTAGLRESGDQIEMEGIRRTHLAATKADHLLLVVDGSEINDINELLHELPNRYPNTAITIIINKIDLLSQSEKQDLIDGKTAIYLSAKSGAGIHLLQQHLKESMGWQADSAGVFIARRRHLDALQRALSAAMTGKTQLVDARAGELLAEELLRAQNALGEITGKITPDDLLGKIFATFCIGK